MVSVGNNVTINDNAAIEAVIFNTVLLNSLKNIPSALISLSLCFSVIFNN